ncbi:acetyl-CoA carboxylase biotin carboxyl carrier protein subunit [Candidatus Pelagibacter sp.]|jgi:acetyl-CoA carboxylase biotin carboxyl carrier protein|nr:acetyl-CoA carboxylase biotin carboxyl carrier protein subunit [Candidatus Pelagibacter sp.]MDC3097870.1 acetyl-CoA carboxylase biotin carboxyl carrier protein subunit [Candidatus Pelagibacter sp.]|tara:strand:+ start:143 stop:565 length:423 start_codon:yes stop_codon:yes gene_type:complete
MKINKNIIKELTEYLNEFNLTEIEYTEKDIKVKVSKSSGSNLASIKEIKSEIKTENIKIDNVSGTEVPSPIIGTAYLAPEPGGKKFVEVGKKINKGDTIMIVEAMKTMNHVPSPIAGTVKKICVEDGQPVEYGHTIAIIE